ncbi:MAG: hypothetical protein K0V04_30200 [Deltaproteobacteria bacterium]|nr:hypothetical protein [Deltaproteobacteria bacterium]
MLQLRTLLALVPLIPLACVAPEDFDQDLGDEAMLDEDALDFDEADALVDPGSLEPLEAASPGPLNPGGPWEPLPWPWPPLDDEQWETGETNDYIEWDSGKTNSLSSWKKAYCYTNHGPNFLLTDLRAYREPSSNWDNFTARLRATCTEYDNDSNTDFVQTSDTATIEVYSGNHRTPGETTAITVSDEYPAGVLMENAVGDGYVKTLRILKVSEQSSGFLGSYGNPFLTAAVPGMPNLPPVGPLRTLACADQQVLTGLRLKYDTRNGKIRRVGIYCRTLSKE